MAEFKENTETLPEINFSNLSRGDINKIMRENYLEYARHSVKERAMCDIRDGLKPVQRRILYSMLESKLFHNKPYEKVSKRVGYVMGEYHPHGDSSITTALVNMGIPWKMNRSYTDILGNYGSVDGDMHAAARYIETRLTKAGEEFGDDLHKDIVPYEPNYDETKIIPIFLPTKLPQLLINGTEGLAVGIASKILPHNPEEVIESYKYYLENPKATIEELCKILKGPDFPTKGTIVNKDELIDIYKSGIGTVTVEGKIKYDKKNNSLHIYEIPFTISGSINTYVADLYDMTQETTKKRKDGKIEKQPPKLPFITDVESHSGIDGLDIKITLKRNTDIDYAINEVYRLTKLRSNLRFAFIALNNKKVKLYNLKSYFDEFTECRLEVIKNKHLLKFKELLKEEHKLQGYLKLQKVIDEVIACAKVTNGKDELINILKTGKLLKHHKINKNYITTVNNFDFSDEQANIIANLQIYRINKLNFDEYKQRLADIKNELVNEITYIKDEKLQKQELIDTLPKLQTPRKTEITNKELKVIELEAQNLFYSFNDDILSIKQRNSPECRHIMSNERLFAMSDTGIVWNIYLDKLTKGQYAMKKLFPTENIVGVADSHSKILTIYNDGHVKYSNGEDYMTKSKAKKVNASNKLTVQHFLNLDDDIIINGKKYENIPLQGIKGKGRKILKNTSNLLLEFETKGDSNNDEQNNIENDN